MKKCNSQIQHGIKRVDFDLFSVDKSDFNFLCSSLKTGEGSKLSEGQKEAIETGLKQAFTVVQGPAGSGKTVAAAHLALLYVKRNKMTPQSTSASAVRTQVLVSAPTQTALDGIACKFPHSHLVNNMHATINQMIIDNNLSFL